MKIASSKALTLFRLIISILVLITAITLFIFSEETDRYKIFMRGLMLVIFTGYSISYIVKFVSLLKADAKKEAEV